MLNAFDANQEGPTKPSLINELELSSEDFKCQLPHTKFYQKKKRPPSHNCHSKNIQQLAIK